MDETEPTTPRGGDKQDHTNQREGEPKVQPRIYVASLSDYNAGRLHGTWLDADVEAADLAEGVQAMLARSPEPGAEEYAIHDYEGFGPLHLSEYESLESVSTIAQGISEHGPAFAHWAALVETRDVEALSQFDDAYRGHYGSLAEYAESLLDDIGLAQQLEAAVPGFLEPYVRIDVEAFGRDLELSGDVTACPGDGGVYIFEGTV